jgi:hypothetical protein
MPTPTTKTPPIVALDVGARFGDCHGQEYTADRRPNARTRLASVTASTRVDEFEQLRPHLLAVAYRLTGTVADAEDIVQDAWLRWDGSSGAITDLRAWLTTVVSRLSLDRRYGPGWLESNQLAMVNGQLGSYTRGSLGRDGYPAMTPRVTAMTVRDGRVCAIWDIANPDKFTGSPLARSLPSPTEPGTHHPN